MAKTIIKTIGTASRCDYDMFSAWEEGTDNNLKKNLRARIKNANSHK